MSQLTNIIEKSRRPIVYETLIPTSGVISTNGSFWYSVPQSGTILPGGSFGQSVYIWQIDCFPSGTISTGSGFTLQLFRSGSLGGGAVTNEDRFYLNSGNTAGSYVSDRFVDGLLYVNRISTPQIHIGLNSHASTKYKLNITYTPAEARSGTQPVDTTF